MSSVLRLRHALLEDAGMLRQVLTATGCRVDAGHVNFVINSLNTGPWAEKADRM